MEKLIKEECFTCGAEISGEPAYTKYHKAYCSSGCQKIDEISSEINAIDYNRHVIQKKLDDLDEERAMKIHEKQSYRMRSND